MACARASKAGIPSRKSATAIAPAPAPLAAPAQTVVGSPGTDATAPMRPLIAAGLELHSPIPNPRRGRESVTLEFALPEACSVGFEVIDIAGRQIAARLATRFESGLHRVAWPIDPLSPGIYFVRMRTTSGEMVNTKLAILP